MRAYSTLVWEQWRQTGLLVLAALLSVVMVQVLDHANLLPDFGIRNTESLKENLAWFFAGISVLLLFVHEDTHGLRLDFPRRMLTSPVSTTVLVTIPLLYRVVLISAVGLAIATPANTAVFDAVATLVSAVALAQVLSCSATAFGVGGAAALGGALAILGGGYVYAVQEDVLYGIRPDLAAAVLLSSWAFSLYAISHARGRFPGLPLWIGKRSPAMAVNTARRDAAQLRSQVWFEWQRVLRWMLLASALLIGISAVVMHGSNNRVEETPFMLLFLICWAAGYLLLRVQGASESLCARLPWSTAALARAKIYAGITGVAGILCVVAVWAFLCADRYIVQQPVIAGAIRSGLNQYIGAQRGLFQPQRPRLLEYGPWQFYGIEILSLDAVTTLAALGALLFATLMAGRMLLPVLGGLFLLGTLATNPAAELPPSQQVLLIPLTLGGIAALLSAAVLLYPKRKLSPAIVLESAGWFAFMAGSLWVFELQAAELFAFTIICLELLVLLGQTCHRLRLAQSRPFTRFTAAVTLGMVLLFVFDIVVNPTVSKEILTAGAILYIGCIPFYWVPLSLHWQRHA